MAFLKFKLFDAAQTQAEGEPAHHHGERGKAGPAPAGQGSSR